MRDIIGVTHFYRLRASYARVMATLIPGDRDGDGLRDGVEIFWRHVPGRSMVELSDEQRDFVLRDVREWFGNSDQLPSLAVSHSRLELPTEVDDLCTLQPGERRRVQARVLIHPEFWDVDYPQFAFKDHWPLVLNVTEPIPVDEDSLAPPGDSETKLPAQGVLYSRAGAAIRVTAPTEGTFEFDLEIPSTARADLNFHARLEVSDATSRDTLVEIQYRCAWRWPEVAVVVENLLSRVHKLEDDLNGKRDYEERFFRLSWPPVDQAAEAILLEVAHDQPGAHWFPVLRYPPAETTCTLVFPMEAVMNRPYRGRLKFRLIPISSKRPGT